MVVQSVDVDSKLITTVWFSDAHEAQQGVFPAGALDKVDVSVAAAKKSKPEAGKKR
jgi:hypothetical protein